MGREEDVKKIAENSVNTTGLPPTTATRKSPIAVPTEFRISTTKKPDA